MDLWSKVWNGRKAISPQRAPSKEQCSSFLVDEQQHRDLHVRMEYRALDQKRCDVRLLEIIQATGQPAATENKCETSDQVNWRLNHHRLRDCHGSRNGGVNTRGTTDLKNQYLALSYTWGDPDDLDQIFVDGMALIVRSNLKQALLALRDTPLVAAGCKIWTDALCINQKNISEVNSEVKRMTDIYRQAVKVVVWLGEEADGSGDAIDFINHINDAFDSDEENVRECVKNELQARGPPLWAALSKLITRNYWTRLWIIQELVLGVAIPWFCAARKLRHGINCIVSTTHSIFSKPRTRHQALHPSLVRR